jgi:hypothetical protein
LEKIVGKKPPAFSRRICIIEDRLDRGLEKSDKSEPGAHPVMKSGGRFESSSPTSAHPEMANLIEIRNAQ